MQSNIRFFRVQTDCPLKKMVQNASLSKDRPDGGLMTIAFVGGDLDITLDVFFKRMIQVARRTEDGGLSFELIETTEKIKIKFFEGKRGLVLAAINPPRGSKYVDYLLEKLTGEYAFFYEALEISELIITKHVSKFDIARLVSAKIRDFAIYENAVARLEVSSKHGLKEGIAPFLTGKHYKLDSVTYEITHKFSSFLVTYTSSGTLKINELFVDSVLPRFASML